MELCVGGYNGGGECMSLGAVSAPTPSTPKLTSSTDEETKVVSMLHTPSPIFLNPMTEEDWSTRKPITSSLHLSLTSGTNDSTRKLVSGVQLQLLLSRSDDKEKEVERKAVTMRFDEGKSILCITFEDEEDEKKGDDDNVATATEPLHIPIFSIASIEQQQGEESDDDSSKCLFELHLRYPMLLPEIKVKCKSFEFGCASIAKKKKIVDCIQTLIDRPSPLLRRRHSRVLSRCYSPLDGRFSPMSLTEDPSREDCAISPASSMQASLNGGESPLVVRPQIRMHEAVTSLIVPDTGDASGRGISTTFNSSFQKLPTTPAEQGVELMLVDITPNERGTLRMPLFSDGSDNDSSNLEQQQVSELLPDPPASSLFGAGSTVNPWCENGDDAACALAEVTDAFAELFGVGAVQPTNISLVEPKQPHVEDHLYGSGIVQSADPSSSGNDNDIQHLDAIHRDAEDLQCLGFALLVAEEMSVSSVRSLTAEPISRKPSAANLRRKNDHIRNRSESINRQARHLQELRDSMTFDAVYSRKVMQHLQISKSVDEGTADKTISPRRLAKSRQFSLFQAVDDVFDSFYGFDFSERDEEEDILYYDSDPEHARERTCRRGSRQATAEHWNRSVKRRRVPKLNFPKHILRRSSSLSDGDMKGIVDLMKSCTMHLLWHPNPDQDGAPSTARPCCIQAWIERGTYLLNQNFVQPKFMWKPAVEAQLGNRRKINLSVEYFDLLEIVRIDNTPKAIDRSAYPLAHEPSCFAIKTKKDYFLFQAQSVGEKSQVVFGLKLVVARLASLLIVRDMAAVEEFFEPMDAVVPGQAPVWVTGK